MQLSIIVPVYNAEKYLQLCLDSILNQNISDYEIILVNDGSKDRSGEILEQYSLEYPNCVRVLTVENGGQGRARNIALEIAKGRFIGFVDSDDWIEEDMFSKLLRLINAEDADVAVCDSWRVEDGNKKYEKACPIEHPLASAGTIWNKLIRRSIIGEVRFPERVWYEDLAFSAQILLKSKKTVFIHEALYDYRSDHTSTMRNQNAKKNLDIITVMDEIITHLGTEKKEYIDFLLINHILLESIKRVNLQKSPDKKQVITVLRKYVKQYIPDLLKCESFRKDSINRKIIIWLNYFGLEDISQALLNIKAKFR